MYFDQNVWLYILLTLVLATAILYTTYTKPSPSHYPPGTKGVPILGVLPYMAPNPQKAFKKWSLEKYGPIMSIEILGHKQVVVNTYDLLKEAYLRQGVATSGRYDSFLFGKLQGNNGIVFIDYTLYVETQKAFGLKFLKEFGPNGMSNIVNNEINYFLKSLEKKVDKPVNIHDNIFDVTANVVYKIVCGRRYEYGDATSKIIYNTFDNIFGVGNDPAFLFMIELRPFLRWFPPFLFAYNRYLARTKPGMDWIKSFIKEAKENLDKNEEPYFVKEYLKEARRRNDPDENQFTDVQLVAYTRDHMGGIKNTSTTLRWMVLCALLNPDHHKKVVQEIDEVLEKDEIPSSSHRASMPITCAFIEEVLRTCSPVLKPLEARLLQDMRLGKYIIPKGVQLSGNLWGANHDPETWPEPDKFDPFRHIDKEGRLISPTKVIQFLLGKRRCYGEDIVQSLLFLVFTRLLQQYEIAAPEEIALPAEGHCHSGITHDSINFEIVLKKRN